MTLLSTLNQISGSNKKAFAVLIDPDKCDRPHLGRLINMGIESNLDYFFVGGSFIKKDNLESIITTIKSNSHIPVVLFPGDVAHLNKYADAVLFLSLISGRNPEYLIGQQVMAAPLLRKMELEVVPTGYMIIGNHNTTVAYISNTRPIPSDNNQLAVSTACAGELLGLKAIYLDAGSGAKFPVPSDMIKLVKAGINIPLIVGGGLKTAEMAMKALAAGADVVVIGNGIEENPELFLEVAESISRTNSNLDIH